MPGKTTKKTTTRKPRVERTGTRQALVTRNGALLSHHMVKEYESFLEVLDAQITRNAILKTEEFKRLEEEEEEAFQRACNLYTKEQLAMTLSEFENISLNEEKPEKAKPKEKEKPQKNGSGSRSESGLKSKPTVDVDATAEAPVFKVPLRPKKQNAKVCETPVFAGKPPTPRFLTTGIKNAKPRPGRIGEMVYSENGSPVVVTANPELKVPKKVVQKTPLADDV